MPRKPITASLEEFARTGRLGPIVFGMARQRVADLLGPPPQWMADQPVSRSGIWMYGDVELHFVDGDDYVWLIHVDDGLGHRVPRGSRTLRLDPWVIRAGLPLADLEAALAGAGIQFRRQADQWNPGCLDVITAAGAKFKVRVEAEHDGDELGLVLFNIVSCES